jgi:hypothetical protein
MIETYMEKGKLSSYAITSHKFYKEGKGSIIRKGTAKQKEVRRRAVDVGAIDPERNPGEGNGGFANAPLSANCKFTEDYDGAMYLEATRDIIPGEVIVFLMGDV